jgi:hypothetical protein
VALSLVVIASAAGYLFWLASPSLLPVTDGPDVVHHLQLIHLIQRTHRLAHDPALAPYLLEMTSYTPAVISSRRASASGCASTRCASCCRSLRSSWR